MTIYENKMDIDVNLSSADKKMGEKIESEPMDIREEDKEPNVEHSLFKIEEFYGIFNSMTMDYMEGLTEERYKYLLTQISNILSGLQKIIPKLKTQEEIQKEAERFSIMFDSPPIAQSSGNQINDFGEDIDWGFPSLEEESSQVKK